MRDGPRLPPATRRLYETFSRFTDPETGYSTPSHEDLADVSVISVSSLKEHFDILEEFGKIRKTHRSTPETGTLPNAYYFVGIDMGLVPREMNPPCNKPLKAAREIFRQEELAARDNKHAADRAVLVAEKELEQQYSTLLEEALKALGNDLPPRPEPLPSNGTSPPDFVAKEVDTPPSQNLATPPSPAVSDRYRRVAVKVRQEWGWMHSSFDKAGININGAIRYFARSAENEEDLEFQIANYYAGEEAKRRPRSAYQRPESQADAERDVGGYLSWDDPDMADPTALELWRTVLDDLQMQLPRPTFETWLRPTRGQAIAVADDREVMVVSAPTHFAVEWLEKRMFHALLRTLESVAGRPMELELRVRAAGSSGGEEEPPQEVEAPGNGAAQRGENDSGPGGEDDV